MSEPSRNAVLGYYRGVWAQILRHSARGRVLASAGRDDLDPIWRTVSTPEALLEDALLEDAALDEALLDEARFGESRLDEARFGNALVAGAPITAGAPRIGLFLADHGALLLRIRPGDGADIATAATTALDLSEQVAADGGVPVPLTDGFGGLLVMSRATGDVLAAARRYAAGIAARAPELATLEAAQADGRCVVQTGWSIPKPGSAVPALPGDPAAYGIGPAPVPYSLVLGPDGPTPVVPLHLDEVAAVAAGMPLDLGADEVLERLATRGDLAAPLLDAGTA